MNEEKDLMENSENTAEINVNTDETTADQENVSEVVTEETTIAKLKLEIQEQKDKYLRLFAEFDNFKRRNAKERLELILTASKEVITDLLEVLDDMDRAEKQLQQSDDLEKNKEGIQLVFNKLRNKLQSKGLNAMDSIETEFDVEKHEAIAEIPADSDGLIGKVVDEIEKGYLLNDKIIRFAKVVVGK